MDDFKVPTPDRKKAKKFIGKNSKLCDQIHKVTWESAAKTLFSNAKNENRGRKKGSGEIDDSKALTKLDELLSSGKAKSPHNGAHLVADMLGIPEHNISAAVKRWTRKYEKLQKTEKYR